MVKTGNKIMLTFDLEFWHDTIFLEKYLPETREDHLTESVGPVLELLDKYKAKATFFTTGKVVEKYPAIVKEICNRGHEIASHGYSHQLLEKLNPRQFKAEMVKAIELIEKITEEKPKGFRAPCGELGGKTGWAMPILKDLGFQYHSGRYAVRHSPLREIPIGRAGGVSFRLIPLCLFKKIIKKTGIIYLHLHELYKDTPVVEKAPWFKRFLKYGGVKNALSKFEKLLQSFEFDSIEHILKI